MIDDARALGSAAVLRARVVVVGSGPAGATIAMRLARRGVDVLLLEAGGRKVEEELKDTLRGDTSLSPEHDPLDTIREKRLGGTAAQWGGRCLPLDPMDFAARSWIPNSGWPISAEDLASSYLQAGDLLELGAPEWTAETALGEDAALVTHQGSGITDDRIWRWSPPARFYELLKASPHPALRVLHHAQVVEVLQDSAGGPVTGVRVRIAPDRDITVLSSEVVIAAGGLETARLLLASSRHESAGLGNSHDQVGRHYMIHPVAEVGQLRVQSSTGQLDSAAAFGVSHDGVYVRRMITLNDEVQEQMGLLQVAHALWYPDPRDAQHGSGLLSTFALVRGALARRSNDFKATGIHRRYAETPQTGRHIANIVRDIPSVVGYGASWVTRRWLAQRRLPSFALTSRDGSYRLRFDSEQSPEPENRVTLSQDRDALGMPRLVVDHRVSRADRERLHRGFTTLAERVNSQGMATLTMPSLDEVLDLPFGDGTHQMGLTKMSHTPNTGVVDKDCCVWGVPGLRIASSSVFSTSGMAGPTMTIVALAIRLADDLAAKLDVSA